MGSDLVMAGIVVFLNEERYLPTFLASVAAQTRQPDELLLVDDGSSDRSLEIAQAFAAEHAYARVLRRPARAPERDRLACAGELVAFQWALPQLTSSWDIVAKLDGDIRFSPLTWETLEDAFRSDPSLGMAGPYQSARSAAGILARERTPEEHVRGGSRFYRRVCLDAIAPIPAHLGWDTLDEFRARMRGWRTASLSITDGDTEHLRPVGRQDGVLRAWRRWGVCAWGYGEHPLHVLLVAVQRVGDHPPVLGGINYVLGYGAAAVRRAPRAEPELRAYVRRDQLRRIAGRGLRLGRSAS